MTQRTTLKRVFGIFLLMFLVCIPQSAGARNTAAFRSDSISFSKSFDNLNLNEILQSVQNIVSDFSVRVADGADPINLNLKFDFDFKSSQPVKQGNKETL